MTSSPPPCSHQWEKAAFLPPKPTHCTNCHELVWLWDKKLHCVKCDVFLHESCCVAGVDASAASPKAVPPPCAHVYIEAALLPPRKVFCHGCHELIWLWDKKRCCSLCGIFLHETCFHKDKAGSEEASPLLPGKANDESQQRNLDEGSLGNPHVHELVPSTFVVPQKCDICESIAFLTTGYACTDCEAVLHAECVFKIEPKPHVLSAEEIDQRKATAAETDTAQQAAFSDTFKLLQRFEKRHKYWGFSLLDPTVLIPLRRTQSKIYIEGCNSLSSATPLEISEEWLDRTRNALRYATAAYGTAYETGQMSTIWTNLWMRVGGRHVLHSKHVSNEEAVANVLRIPRESVLFSHWGKGVFDPTYVVLIERDMIVLAFRGSLSDADFLTDAAGELVSFCHPTEKAHAGMVEMLKKCAWNDESPAVKAVKDARAKYPSYKVVVTGHSLGAGLTTLCIAHAVFSGVFDMPFDFPHQSGSDEKEEVPLCHLRGRPWLHGYAFAPPPVLTAPLCDKFDDYLTSVVVGKDVVCRLQLSSVDRLGSRLSGTRKHPSTDDIFDATEECFIAGKIFFSTKPNNKNSRLVLLKRSHVLLREIFLSSYMLENHLMDGYASALAHGAQQLAELAHLTKKSE